MAFHHHLLVAVCLACLTSLLPVPATAAVKNITTPLMLETCKKTAFNDDCVDMLSTSKKAITSDLIGLASVSLTVTERKASKVATHINNLVNANDTTRGPTVQQCLLDCLENYEDIVDQLNDSIGEIDKMVNGKSTEAEAEAEEGDIALWLAAALSDVDTCEKGCSSQKPGGDLLTDRNAEISKYCNITLSIVEQLNPH